MPSKLKKNKKRAVSSTKCEDSGEGDLKKLKTQDSPKIKCNGIYLCDLKGHNQIRNRPNHNIINSLDALQRGFKPAFTTPKACRDVLIRNISSFHIYKSESPFDRRITAIEWHPKHPEIVAVGSKGGDILAWKYGLPIDDTLLFVGKGPGGSIQAMKFHPEKEMEVYTCGIDGTVASWDYVNKTRNIFLETRNFDKWYTSLDVNFGCGHFVTGDNTGYLSMLDVNGTLLWKKKIHKHKISHAEYNAKQPWLLTTASIDRTVKMWDVRNMKDKPLVSLEHEHGVNSAYFSSTDACRLLTTDQKNELRVYKGPLWNLETSIAHPHRQFQHLTQIKATWHPLVDIVVVGRYPDEHFPGYVQGELRTVDFFDAETGKYLHGLSEPGFSGIISVNKFNNMGDTLASGMGLHILIWRPRWKHERSNPDKPSDPEAESGPRRPGPQRPAGPSHVVCRYTPPKKSTKSSGDGGECSKASKVKKTDSKGKACDSGKGSSGSRKGSKTVKADSKDKTGGSGKSGKVRKADDGGECSSGSKKGATRKKHSKRDPD